jgi:hypothetical protein
VPTSRRKEEGGCQIKDLVVGGGHSYSDGWILCRNCDLPRWYRNAWNMTHCQVCHFKLRSKPAKLRNKENLYSATHGGKEVPRYSVKTAFQCKSCNRTFLSFEDTPLKLCIYCGQPSVLTGLTIREEGGE